MLAMTDTREDEEILKQVFAEYGLRSVVTAATGSNTIIRPKLVNSIIGACLNSGLIEKKPTHVHPLVHAIQEASYSAKIETDVSQNCQLKIAVVRRDPWISIGIYGNIAIHEISNHKTVGSGNQVIAP
nr:HutP family protein [Anaerotruncus sp. DFI.9.16]